ncbi:type I restriction enzyme endonuclease domain-containing protein [Virgibacillus sp. L01]|uniref:type I restriction enzyme endonuclease domain-containing protein n=1 Tax=Virgibacillus sp. L01 TaxID=3457429 RepID=UPI003FD2D86D
MLEKELEEFEQEDVKDLTHIVTGIIREHAVIDWTVKDDVKREIHRRIKKKLRKYNCPGAKVEALAIQLMDPAEVHYKHTAY